MIGAIRAIRTIGAIGAIRVIGAVGASGGIGAIRAIGAIGAIGAIRGIGGDRRDFCTFAGDELEEVALDATSDRLRYDLSPAGRYSDTLAREMQQILLGLIGFDSVL